MPIPCVDLLVLDGGGNVLLLKRSNEPAKGLWWFPGGRVHLGETRPAAALRKLAEECGLEAIAEAPEEILTADLILPDGQGGTSHTISTVFYLTVPAHRPPLRLDDQTYDAAWRPPPTWLAETLDPFVRRVLTARVKAESR